MKKSAILYLILLVLCLPSSAPLGWGDDSPNLDDLTFSSRRFQKNMQPLSAPDTLERPETSTCCNAQFPGQERQNEADALKNLKELTNAVLRGLDKK